MGLSSRLNKVNEEALLILKRKKKMELFRDSVTGWDKKHGPMPEDKFSEFLRAIYYSNQSFKNH